MRGVLTNYETPKRPVVHISYCTGLLLYGLLPYTTNNSPFFYGHPAFALPGRCAKPVYAKLEEAFHVFIPADDGMSVWQTACMLSISARARAAGPISW